jgi:hypothetical protein
MDIRMKLHVTAERQLPFECVASVLEGGGTLARIKQSGMGHNFALN